MTVLKLTERLGQSEDTDWNEEQRQLDKDLMRRLACCEKIMKEQRSLFRQTSLLVFFKSSSRTRTSLPVPLDTGYEDPYDPPQIKRNGLLPKLPFVRFHISVSFSWSK